MQVAHNILGMRQGFQILEMCINLAGTHARFSEKNQKSIMHINFMFFGQRMQI